MRCRVSSSFRVRRLVAAASLAVLALSAVGRRRIAAGPGRIRQPPRVGLQARRRSHPASGAGGALGYQGRTSRGRGAQARRAPRGSSTGPCARSRAVPRPALDEAQLAKWFDYLRLQESYLAKAAAALRAERIVQYQHNAVRFVHTGNLANDVVIAFGFNYCRFKFSRFG